MGGVIQSLDSEGLRPPEASCVDKILKMLGGVGPLGEPPGVTWVPPIPLGRCEVGIWRAEDTWRPDAGASHGSWASQVPQPTNLLLPSTHETPKRPCPAQVPCGFTLDEERGHFEK